MEKSEKLPDSQYDVPHHRLVRQFPIVDSNLRGGQGAENKNMAKESKIWQQFYPRNLRGRQGAENRNMAK